MRNSPTVHGLLVLALALVAQHAAASSDAGVPRLWGGLAPGRYAVGIAERFERDMTRPALPMPAAGKPSAGRQMQLVVWYPADRADAEPLSLRDYVELGAGILGPASRTDDSRAEAVARFEAEPLAAGIEAESIAKLQSLPMRAVRDAPRAPGRFPLVLFLHSTAWGASVMSEVLASHGFVVAAFESKGAREPAYRLSRENVDAMVDDAVFAVARIREEKWVAEELGVVGMSNGAIAAMALQLRDAVPGAIVSLDGGIGEGAGGTYLRSKSGDQPMRLAAPLLHLYTPDNPHLDLQYVRSYEAAPRMLVRVAHLRHADFLAHGAMEAVVPGLFGAAPKEAPVGFETVVRYTVDFMRAHLAGDRGATRRLAAAPEANGVPAGLVDLERLPATRSP